jgi:hypothetical protein
LLAWWLWIKANHLATILLAFDDSDRVSAFGKCRESVFCGVTQTETSIDCQVAIYAVANPLITSDFDVHFVERFRDPLSPPA